MARLSKEEWIKQNKEDREMAVKIRDNESNKVAESTAELIKYLDVQTRFEPYSVGNCLLITAMKPDAIQCKEEAEWSKRGYPIRDNKSPILITEATAPKIMEDGTTQTRFNTKRVYDITQTSAPLPEKEETISNKELLSGLLKASPINVNPVEDVGKEGKFVLYNSETNQFDICRGKDINFLIQDFVTEVAKYHLLKMENINKESIPFKATCICYMFCKKYDIPFPQDNFETQRNLISGEGKEVRKELATIKDLYVKIKSEMIVEIERLSQKDKSKEQVR